MGNEKGVGGRVRNVVCEKGRWRRECCRHVWRGGVTAHLHSLSPLSP